MFFCELRALLTEVLRDRVRNGEISERALARQAGLSQPHLHNVLKGARTLSPEAADKLLACLNLSVWDLISGAGVNRPAPPAPCPDGGDHANLPVLDGLLGPQHAWPGHIASYQMFPVSSAAVRRMWLPVVARLALDVRMLPLFGEGDFALLDQHQEARTVIEDDGLYLIRQGQAGVLRRIRRLNHALYLASEDCLDRPGVWERLPFEGQQLLHFVRARATLIAPLAGWR